MSVHKGGQYKPLSDSDVELVHESVMTLLEKGGVKVYTKTGREVFRKAGAHVNNSTNFVRIPKSMVEDAIDKTPSKLILCGRDPENDCILEGNNVYLGTGGTAINVIDLKTGKRRPSTDRDVRQMARLTDALPNVHVFTINVYPNDVVNKDEVDANRFYSSIINTSKHVMGGIYTAKGMKDVVEMAAMIAGGRGEQNQRVNEKALHRLHPGVCQRADGGAAPCG